jgi:hypothetical protein
MRELLLHWFQNMFGSHNKYRVMESELPPFVPQRLMEIIRYKDETAHPWWLVTVTSIGIGIVPCTTLNHSWGSYHHEHLVKDNIESLSEIPPDTTSPSTYRYAL